MEEDRPLTKAELMELLEPYTDDTILWCNVEEYRVPIIAVGEDEERRLVLYGEWMPNQEGFPGATTRGQ